MCWDRKIGTAPLFSASRRMSMAETVWENFLGVAWANRSCSTLLHVMQISLGRRGDYGVRAAVFLARRFGRGWQKSREIADEMSIPEKYLPQVLGDLIRAGIVVSLAGPRGGYMLTGSPEQLSLLEVVEATGGPVRSNECVMRGQPCRRWQEVCAVHDAWVAAQEAMVAELAATALSLLADRDEELSATKLESGSE